MQGPRTHLLGGMGRVGMRGVTTMSHTVRRHRRPGGRRPGGAFRAFAASLIAALALTAFTSGFMVRVPRAAAVSAPATSGTTPYVSGTSIAWDAENLPISSTGSGGALSGVAGGGPGLVAVGADDGGTGPLAGSEAASWVSTDGGTTWMEHLVPGAGSLGFIALAAHGGTFVAASSTGFWSSADGATWVQASSGPRTVEGAALAAGLTGFVAIDRIGSETSAWTSADGSQWHAASASLQGFCPAALTASSSLAVTVGTACSTGAPHLLISTDGATWTRVAVPSGMDTTRASISLAGGRFVIIAPYTDATHYGTAVWSSGNGITWSRTSFLTARAESADRLGDVVPFGAGWIAAGWAPNGADDCTPIVWWSADLVHWTRSTLVAPPTSGTCQQPDRMALSQGHVIAVGTAWDIASTWPAAWVGALVTPPPPQLTLHQASAVGVTESGPYTLATKVVRKGQYVTIRITTSPALAGADIGIWIAKKGPDGRWSAFSPHTGRITNGQGVVDYYYRAWSVAWLSFQAHVDADATHPAALSNAVQARWIP